MPSEALNLHFGLLPRPLPAFLHAPGSWLLSCSMPQSFLVSFLPCPRSFLGAFWCAPGSLFSFWCAPGHPLYLSVPPESSVSLSSPSVFLFFPFVAQQTSPFVLLSLLILSLSPLCASKDFPFCVQRVALRSWSTPLLPR